MQLFVLTPTHELPYVFGTVLLLVALVFIVRLMRDRTVEAALAHREAAHAG